MSLVTQISDLTVRIATEIKSIYSLTGTLSDLDTVDKDSLVDAINEALAAAGAGGTISIDAVTDATTVGKALVRAATAAAARTAIGAGTSDLVIGTTGTTAKAGNYQPTAANISDSTAVGRSVITAVDAPAARTAIGAGTSSLAIGTTAGTAKAGDYQPASTNISDSTSTGRSLLTAANSAAVRTIAGLSTVGEALATAASAAAARTTLGVYSTGEADTAISGAVTAAVNALVGDAPATLDTINEIAAALGDNPSAVTALESAVANRLRFDAAQTLTAPQQAQGQDNLMVYSRTQIGDPTTDFVSTFNAALL